MYKEQALDFIEIVINSNYTISEEVEKSALFGEARVINISHRGILIKYFDSPKMTTIEVSHGTFLYQVDIDDKEAKELVSIIRPIVLNYWDNQ